MLKSKQFNGMNVVSLEEGTQIGSVGGLVINPNSKSVAALIIDQKGWFREQKFIPFSKVHSIGEDVITIDRSSRAEKGTSLPEILKLFKDRAVIIGSRLVTESGTVMGLVDEFYIDLKSGDIVGLEFSGGTVSNLFKGSAFLDANYIMTLGASIVICSDSSLNNAIKMDGGLQETLRAFRENTGQLLDITWQKTRELGQNINQSLERIKRERRSGESDTKPEQNSRVESGPAEEQPLDIEKAPAEEDHMSPPEPPPPDLPDDVTIK
ncbi:MAG: PRC-barrel domain-containing protein [Bacillota bacterium]